MTMVKIKSIGFIIVGPLCVTKVKQLVPAGSFYTDWSCGILLSKCLCHQAKHGKNRPNV